MSSVPEWISVACSLLAAFVAVITLLTVLAAARQLLTEHRAYQLGLSPESLGVWRSKVERKSLLDQHPTGDPERCLAKASWVNFMKALGLSPATENLYTMNVQSELINGIIPMRWKGKDLVGICSMLGFQLHEDKPSFKSPMPLPTQWSGPLGWLQFRASADGCICEYRPRRHLENQLPQQVHDSYKDTKKPDQPHSLKSRLWQSINGMSMLDDRLLYLGGTDRRRPGEDLQRSVDGLLDSNKSSADSDTSRPQNDHLFDELMMAADLTQEDVIGRMAGGKKEQPDELTSRLKQLEKEIDSLSEFPRGIAQKKGTKEVLQPCPGLLSVVIEGELAQSRGLDIGQCQEYHRTYTEHDKVDRKKYPYSLGALCMDDDMLELMKDAIALLKPDGFCFSPTAHLYSDVAEVYSHVDSQSNKLERIFPDTLLTDMSANHQDIRELHDSMVLCNRLQHIRKNVRAVFTVEDMLVICKASVSLATIISNKDLVWAMLIQPNLFANVTERFASLQIADVLETTVECKAGEMDCTELIPLPMATNGERKRNLYTIPLCSDGKFTGVMLLAACVDVFLTYFWIEMKWISDVAMYDYTVPQTITMC